MTVAGETGRPSGRRQRYRARAATAVLALVIGPALLAPAPEPSPPPVTAAPTPTGGGVPTPTQTGTSGPSESSAGPTRDRGTQLYLESCASCHGPGGEGSQRGPTLIGVGPASVDFQLRTGRMPLTRVRAQPPHRDPVFTAPDIEALVRHVDSFGGGGPPIPRVGPGDVRTGRELFLANCAACHSATGAGTALTNDQVAPALDRSTAIEVAEAVRVGPGLMPAFPGTVLTDQQVDALAAYVGVLQSDQLDRGGAALGRLGPTTEGLVAWVVGLLLIVLAVRWLGTRADR
ncbi:c-type cytochrome [Micromonospora polyrhachis]|uniref:Ubiquinol-cytochrome c reductase cytochrome c subunit n=1 Tax=Micromonospora polyrhachis TaxID=1282883 RepID=A0A7W7SX59_9ACTN|nr:c-type cytochrome [Micromonospora polyrhachis]MBB4962528.1 ubiquinol-cytochrome c reductase cytochrome c subunit [Micromonospora polyrhachis]